MIITTLPVFPFRKSGLGIARIQDLTLIDFFISEEMLYLNSVHSLFLQGIHFSMKFLKDMCRFQKTLHQNDLNASNLIFHKYLKYPSICFEGLSGAHTYLGVTLLMLRWSFPPTSKTPRRRGKERCPSA